MGEVGSGRLVVGVDVGGWVFLLVPAHPGIPRQRAVKQLWVCVCVQIGTSVTAVMGLLLASVSTATFVKTLICVHAVRARCTIRPGE